MELEHANHCVGRMGVVSALGQKQTNHRVAKIHLCLLWSNSGQTAVRLDCPLSANSGHRDFQRHSVLHYLTTVAE
jgi:hypothetical protein